MFFLIFCFLKTPEDLSEIGSFLIASLICSAFYVVVSRIVFEYLFDKDTAEKNELRDLKVKLSELEDEEDKKES